MTIQVISEDGKFMKTETMTSVDPHLFVLDLVSSTHLISPHLIS